MAYTRKSANAMTLPHIIDLIEESHHVKPSAVPSDLKAAVIKTPYYYLPDDVDPFERSVILAMMTIHGRSSDSDISKWKTWILSYFCICYPELTKMIQDRNKREYVASEFPADLRKVWMSTFLTVDESDDPECEESMAPHPRFPELSEPMLTSDVVASNDLNGLYCYASLLLFLAGKTIGPSNRSSITSKRPRALMSEFQTTGSEFILSGAGRLGDPAHAHVTSSWTALVDPRITIVTYFASTMTVPVTPYRIMAHTMRLKRMNGMNYVNLIIRFLEDFDDFIAEIPQLRSDIRAFLDSASRWETIDKSMRPFYKFAYGNECTIFRRREMQGLIACGIIHAANHSETVINYQIDEGYSNVLRKVEKVAMEHGREFVRRSDQAVVTHAL